MEFSTTLLREKFILRDLKGDIISAPPMIATSNRMAVPLINRRGDVVETFVVRAQSMHSCIRMATKLVQTFQRVGPIMAREEAFDFEDAWLSLSDDHDVRFNPARWVAVYHKGKVIFESGGRHPFLDVIEKCDSKNPGNYDNAVTLAEDAFRKAGHNLTISHDASIGLVITVKVGSGRGGLILRNPNKRTTFNFIVEDRGEHKVTVSQCLTVAAALLEGIQLAFQIGMTNEKLRQGLIERFSPSAKEADSGRQRMVRLSAEVKNFENLLDVRYRPEKPEFPQMVLEAERFVREQNSRPPREEQPDRADTSS